MLFFGQNVFKMIKFSKANSVPNLLVKNLFVCGTLGPIYFFFLVKLLTFNELVSSLMAIKILCGIDKMKNIMLNFSRQNDVKHVTVISQNRVQKGQLPAHKNSPHLWFALTHMMTVKSPRPSTSLLFQVPSRHHKQFPPTPSFPGKPLQQTCLQLPTSPSTHQ